MSEVAVPAEPSLARATAAMTALTAVSRLTGFARIIVVAAVLGPTFLGDTYQSTNAVPNLLFELFAAGALQAVLIPTLVGLIDRRDRAEADQVAGAVLGLTALSLGVLSILAMPFAPMIARFLVGYGPTQAIIDGRVRLGIFFLWFFLPQTAVYCVGMVASAALNARDRFVIPVAAPIVNNVVVIGTYLLFAAERRGKAPSLDLSFAERVTLAGGTTLGVVAFCAVPYIAARRMGWRLRPTLDWRAEPVRGLARQGAWAGLYLAMTQLVTIAVLVLANRVEGGVVSWQVAFTVFLLPHALFAVPALTALFPTLSRRAQAGDAAGYGANVRRGMAAIVWFAVPATAGLMALGHPLARVVLLGRAADGADTVGAITLALAPGIAGYGAFLFLTRAWYARGDARTPALANVIVGLAAIGAMTLAFAATTTDRVAALGGAHSAAYLLGSLALLAALARISPLPLAAMAGDFLRALTAGALAFVVMEAARRLLDLDGRGGAAITVALAGAAGAVVYLGGQALLGRGRPLLPDLLRSEAATGG